MIQYKRPLVQIRNLVKQFDDGHIAVDDVELDIYEKEFFGLLGSSGSGKSTLLRMLAGFEKPTKGHIIIDGIDMTHVPPYDRPVNMMFQSYALFPHMSVHQNICFGLKQDKLPIAEIHQRAEEVLELVKMQKYAKRKPHQLSGGQRQRVALARCLAKRPKLILLDEPLSALDKNLRDQMQFELVDIQEKTGSTFVMVTHDQAEAMTMTTRIGILKEGWLEQVSAPTEIYEFPSNRYVANFIGTTALFEGSITAQKGTQVTISSDEANCDFYFDRKLEGVLGQRVWVGLRPEKISISKQMPEDYDYQTPKNCIVGRVEDIAYLGGLSTYYVRTQKNSIVKATDFNVERRADHPTWDDKVYLTWDAKNMMVLYS